MHSFFIFPLVAIFNSFMDTIDFRLAKSIWSKIDPNTIDPHITGAQPKNFFGIMTLDPWHKAKSLALIAGILSILFYTPMYGKIIDGLILWAEWFIFFEIPWRLQLK